MMIAEMHWQPYRLPLRQEFSTSDGTLQHRYGAIVELTFDGGSDGVGEVAPLPYYEQAVQYEQGLVHDLFHEIYYRPLDDVLAQVVDYTKTGAYPSALLCGFEIALLDAIGKQQQRTIASLLAGDVAPIRSAVPVNAVIGVGDLDACVEAAQAAVAAGYTCVKLKVGMLGEVAHEIRRVAAVRTAIGSMVALRLDANATWTLDEATDFLNACVPNNIQYVEQPLPVDDLNGLCQLRQRVSIPIAADEALTDLASAERVLDNAAADVLIIKPQAVGGLSVSREIVHLAAERGIQCVLTSAIESGVGVAATLQLAAALPEVTLPCGLATLPLLADDLIVEELAISNGKLTVPQGAGLGVTLDAAAVSRYAV